MRLEVGEYVGYRELTLSKIIPFKSKMYISLEFSLSKYLPYEQCRRVVEAAVDFLIEGFRPHKPHFLLNS